MRKSFVVFVITLTRHVLAHPYSYRTAKKHLEKVRQDAVASEGKQHANPNVQEALGSIDLYSTTR